MNNLVTRSKDISIESTTVTPDDVSVSTSLSESFEPAKDPLKALQIAYKVKAVCVIVFGLLPLVSLGLFEFVLNGLLRFLVVKIAPDNFMLFFRTGSVVFFVVLALYALLLWRVSKRIQQRVRYRFVMVMSFFSLFTGVLGLLLGLFSLVQLSLSKHRKTFV
ncbi:MAG: hypothetical protein ACPHXR_00695 [Flavicella sp.]